MSVTDTIEAEGHLIDSGLLSAIFDKIIEVKGSYEIITFDIGKTNDDKSRIQMRVTVSDEATLDDLFQQLTTFGAHAVREANAVLKPAEKDRCVSDDFYSTTNHRTHVRLKGRWVEVEKQRMDAVIVVDGTTATCRKLRDVKAGEKVVCGHVGIRVTPEFKERDRHGFAFMSNDVSSERRVEGSVSRIAQMMRDVKGAGGRIAVVAGPVVVHTGGVEHFSALIRQGFVDVVLAGNALAVHDIEFALSGTSLGIDLVAGAPVEQGHRNHMAAINTINRAGGIREAVERGRVEVGRDVRVREEERRVRPRRQHPRRRPAARDGDGLDRSAGALCGGVVQERTHGADALVDAAQHRRRQHAAVVGAGGVRGHQPRRRDEAQRSRFTTDRWRRHRRGALPAQAGRSTALKSDGVRPLHAISHVKICDGV